MHASVRRLVVIAALLALALAVTGSAGHAQTSKITVNIGTIKIGALADLYAAEKLGYFAEQGLDAQLTIANNGNDLISALQSGKLDISLAIPGVAMRAREAGYKLSLVFQNELARGKAPDTGAIMVRADSPISSLKQLTGKKLAISGIGTQAWASVQFVLQKNGVDPASVTQLEIPTPAMSGALQQGLIDAVNVVEPFTSAILNAKVGKVISWNFVESVPNQPIGGFWAADDWLAKNPVVAKKFVKAMHKALTYMVAHPDEAKKIVAEYTGLKPEVIDNMTMIRWDDRVNKSDWQKTIQMLVQVGNLKTPITVEELVPPLAMDPGK